MPVVGGFGVYQLDGFPVQIGALPLVAVASGGITGNSTQTEPAETGSAAGVVLVSGSSVQSEPIETGSAAGAVLVSGSSTQTEPEETGAASGTIGSTAINGDSTQTEPAETGSASGAVLVSGASTQTDPSETGAASGSVLVSGSSISTDPAENGTAAGTVGVTGVTGDSTRTEPSETGSASGSILVAGVSVQIEPAETGIASGVVIVSGTSSQTDPIETGIASGTVTTLSGILGVSIQVEPAETGIASGVVGAFVIIPRGGYVVVDVLRSVMARLSSDSELSTLVGGRIFDVRPQESYLPCVTVERVSAQDFGHKTRAGQDVRLDIACWSSYEGRLECLMVGKRVYDLLHEIPLNVDNATAITSRCEAGDVIEDSDGATRHMRITLKVSAIGTP